MLQQVDDKIGNLGDEIKKLKKDRDAAYKAWQDFTIAAVTTSVGLVLIGAALAPLTGGLSLLVAGGAAIAAGVGLGAKAAANRAKYNQYVALLKDAKVDLKKKQLLRGDLTGLNDSMTLVGPAMAGFVKSLQTIQGVWVQMGTDMKQISESLTPENVGSSAFLVKVKSNVAVDAWKAVDDSAKQFTVESLIDYTSIDFGDPMPESIAA